MKFSCVYTSDSDFFLIVTKPIDLEGRCSQETRTYTLSGHLEAPSGHQEAPSGHSEAPSGHSEAPSGHPEAPSGHQEAPIGHQESPSGHQEASGLPLKTS